MACLDIEKLETKLPHLSYLHHDSFCRFLKSGLVQEIERISPIVDYTGNLELYFYGDTCKFNFPTASILETKRNDATYALQIYVRTVLFNKEAKTTLSQKLVFLGELPLITNRGTFIINGIERVVINQIVRSPGIYFRSETDKYGKISYNATLVSNKGGWLKFETDASELLWVRLDKSHKIPAYIFLKAIGFSERELNERIQFKRFLRSDNQALAAVDSGDEQIVSKRDALRQLYSILRPDEPVSVSGSQQLLFAKFFDPRRYDLGLVGRYKLNEKLNLNISPDITALTPQDILAIVEYLIGLHFDLGSIDDIDHLSNKRVRSVGELLQNQVRVGLLRLERLIKERMTFADSSFLSPSTLINPKPLTASLKEFFGSNPLSQFMDQINPLAEITHKRRISNLGPGGLSKDRTSMAVRDINPSHYGRICPIETPEGPNAGLIGSLASYARVNAYGFIETPFYQVKNSQVLKTEDVVYLTADQEDKFHVATGDIPIDANGLLENSNVPVRYGQDFISVPSDDVEFFAISPIQTFSIAASLIPFLEHDDGNRALMGSNMQRQAVPLLSSKRPIVGTGFETQIARDSGLIQVSPVDGKVSYVSGKKVSVVNDEGKAFHYNLEKYQRSNQDTCINQRPSVSAGQVVSRGQVLVDASATDGGELALGHNITVAYMPWEGFNYEDAFLISERLVYDDLYTSLHIEKFEVEARQMSQGNEEITRDIPLLSESSLSQLDENGIIRKGVWVKAGDILVGKVTPKADSDQPPEGKLLRAIFGERTSNVRDSSLRLPNGTEGRILDIRVFSAENNDDLPSGVNTMVRIYVMHARKIQVGDKMAGRHGNKGIISKILPRQDMPFLPDGKPVDILLNPLGVPSRMNVGQIFECLLGLAGYFLNTHFRVLPFDEVRGAETSRRFVYEQLLKAKKSTNTDWLFDPRHPGKMRLCDGRTGEFFDNPAVVGQAYMLKLIHLVDEKIHARSTGPYSLVTQQPLGGRAQHGGQRFGEMEVWALEAFGAAHTLQELLTVKSDDMQGRNEVINAIVRGKPIPKPGIPESFKVLMRELQSLCLDIAAYKITPNNHTEQRLFEMTSKPSF